MLRALSATAEIAWMFVAGVISACLFASFWVFLVLAATNFPLGLIFGHFPHWLLVADTIFAAVCYTIAGLIGLVLAPIAAAFGGR